MNKKKNIVAFCCENSSVQAAEAVTDKEVLDAVEIVKLPCTGKVEITHILNCFEKDYEGVIVFGCPVDNCQYIKGNERTRKRVEKAKTILRDIGIDEERVRMEFISSMDAHKFCAAVLDMTARITSVTTG